MADELLAAIGGGTQGASRGLSVAISNASGIQNFQNAQQEGAIKQEAFKKYQEEEAQNRKPIYQNDVFKNVPAWAKPTYERELQPYWQNGAQGGEPFIEAGKLREVNKTLNTGILGRYRMMQEGLGWIESQQQPLRQKIDGLKSQFGPILEQRKQAIMEAKKSGDAEKAYKLEVQLKKDLSDPKGLLYQPFREFLSSSKALDALQGQKALLQGKSNQANGMIEKLRDETLLDESTIIQALEGDSDAQAKVFQARKLAKTRSIGGHPVNVKMPDGKIIIADKQEVLENPDKYKGARFVSASINDKEKEPKKEKDDTIKRLDGILKTYNQKIKDLEKNNDGTKDAEIADWKAQRDKTMQAKDTVLRGGKITNWGGQPAPKKIVPKGTQLDEKTAMDYLQKAGGDKDKARKLAKADGYEF